MNDSDLRQPPDSAEGGDIASLQHPPRVGGAGHGQGPDARTRPRQRVTADDAHVVADVTAALADALRALRAEAEQIYADLRALDLPEHLLFADQQLMRTTVQGRPDLREPLERLVARGTATRLAFVDAQYDLVDALQPIARRFVSARGSRLASMA
ncbi:MAG: hypothetical protein L0H96_21290 [Humibacillus sp.]|nr:hypothetical protein [Humibacillus sp.]MDN5779432.1 hypothetical protein [Humibacillus sp.]